VAAPPATDSRVRRPASSCSSPSSAGAASGTGKSSRATRHLALV